MKHKSTFESGGGLMMIGGIWLILFVCGSAGRSPIGPRPVELKITLASKGSVPGWNCLRALGRRGHASHLDRPLRLLAETSHGVGGLYRKELNTFSGGRENFDFGVWGRSHL